MASAAPCYAAGAEASCSVLGHVTRSNVVEHSFNYSADTYSKVSGFGRIANVAVPIIALYLPRHVMHQPIRTSDGTALIIDFRAYYIFKEIERFLMEFLMFSHFTGVCFISQCVFWAVGGGLYLHFGCST